MALDLLKGSLSRVLILYFLWSFRVRFSGLYSKCKKKDLSTLLFGGRFES